MNKGSIITTVLVFGIISLILLGSLLSFILLQLKTSEELLAWEQSLYIAESGVAYYQWCLNHGIEESCDLSKTYLDAEGGSLGEFNLTIVENVSCGEVIDRNISSAGHTLKFPDGERTIEAVYGRVSVAKFAYLIKDSVWAGSDREIGGLYHSNGGIRMDGHNQSIVSSSQNEWVCTDSFGCDSCPASCTLEDDLCMCPGVFTTTENPNIDLFSWPATPFSFEGITVDLAQIKSKAGSDGIYLPPSDTIDVSADGYHLIFNNNGTVEVRIITSLYSNWAYSSEEGWHYDYFRINNEYFYDTYTIDEACSAVFAEDNIWIEGTVDRKVTLASADLLEGSKDTTIILVDDLNYVSSDGTDGFAALAEKDILISPSSPDDMELRGIYIAQKGHFGRNHYPNNLKSNLEIVGSIVSSGRVGTQWTSGSSVVSGYAQRNNYIDSKLIYSPCPFVPYAEYDYKIIKWEEVE